MDATVETYFSPTIANLATSLAAAQSQFEVARKDKDNPYFKSKYADLENVFGAIRHALTSNGLALCQPIVTRGRDMVLVTMLVHTSGEFIRSEMVLPPVIKPQEVGSALTYYRRYSIVSLVGVSVGDEDDDGNAANDAVKAQQAKAKSEVGKKELLEEVESLANKYSAHDAEFLSSVLKHFKVEKLSELSMAQLNTTKVSLNKKLAEKAQLSVANEK